MRLNFFALPSRYATGLLFVVVSACSIANAAVHEPVSADAAAQALAQGASVVDVRSADQFAAGHMAGAMNLPDLVAPMPAAELACSLSGAGIDASRTVLVVGEAGDPRAHALWHTLQTYATGRVLWLVGGTTEWQMRGYALGTQAHTLKPVPQYFVSLQPVVTTPRMAGAALRSNTLVERGLPVKVSVNGF